MGLLDKLLDASVYFSFDQSGFRRHAEDFDPKDLDVDLSGKRFAVTGANSGIGKATALGLAARGASVVLLCRDMERGEKAAVEIKDATANAHVTLAKCDLADPKSVRAAALAIGGKALAGLVHNAGLMPNEREISAFDAEMTAAVHLVGPLLLTTLLLSELQNGGGRVLFVASGGMYTQKLDVEALDNREGDYDGMTAYARTKRAQVVLAEILDEYLDASVNVHSMHPGWVDTPAVESSMPKFYSFTKDRLRTAEEGADTSIWLMANPAFDNESNGFWFDRQRASTEPLPFTKTSDEERAALLPWVASKAGVADDWVTED